MRTRISSAQSVRLQLAKLHVYEPTENLMIRIRTILFFVLIGILSLAAIDSGELQFQSSDLHISKRAVIAVDGKRVGTAPCRLTLQENVRHKFVIWNLNGTVHTFYLTAKTITKSGLLDSIPAWFLDPTLLKKDFPNYDALIPATSSSETLDEAVNKAEMEATRKSKTLSVDRYNTIRESPPRSNMLDSSKSSYYPKLTRGQMDSLNDVNGGKMVLQSFHEESEPVFLEYEIQRVDNTYQVYILAGKK